MDNHASSCLNCAAPLQGAYCYQCGQKATTHRLSIKHFIEHDVIHGIWHVDRGIFYTLWAVLTRPGKLAKDYIACKRAGHFSLVTMLLLLVGLFLFILSLRHIQVHDFKVNNKPGITEFVRHYAKWLMLAFIPIMAKCSDDLFKKLKYNYTEHLVMNGFFFAGVLAIMIIFLGLYFIPGVNNLYVLFAEILAISVYIINAYRQVTSGVYTAKKFTLVMLLFAICFVGYMAGVLAGGMGLYVLFH